MFDGRNQFEPEDLRGEGFNITAWGEVVDGIESW